MVLARLTAGGSNGLTLMTPLFDMANQTEGCHLLFKDSAGVEHVYRYTYVRFKRHKKRRSRIAPNNSPCTAAFAGLLAAVPRQARQSGHFRWRLNAFEPAVRAAV